MLIGNRKKLLELNFRALDLRAPNISFRNSLLGQMYIINTVDKAKFSQPF